MWHVKTVEGRCRLSTDAPKPSKFSSSFIYSLSESLIIFLCLQKKKKKVLRMVWGNFCADTSVKRHCAPPWSEPRGALKYLSLVHNKRVFFPWQPLPWEAASLGGWVKCDTCRTAERPGDQGRERAGDRPIPGGAAREDAPHLPSASGKTEVGRR